jgi:polyisoprenoid-binding protein YceI
MRFFFIILFLGLMATPVLAKTAGKASFSAEGQGLAIDITAENAPVDADIKKDGGKISGTFSVKIADFKTGIALRDEHMCKALSCAEHPKAIFVLAPMDLKDGDGTFSGTLELAGKKAPFSGKATIKGSRVSATASLKLSDFGITPPEYKVARVSNEVEVKVEMAL